VGRTALLDAEDKSFGGSVARAIGRAKVRKPGVTGDEAIWNAIRAAERASLDSGRGDLDERGEERAREHHAAVRAMADIQPMPLDQVPEPEPEPMNLTPRQPELALGVR
jgi:hypothetical protein